ncbi:hypothetical protein Tco_1362600 [Tanacetum coccineum]
MGKQRSESPSKDGSKFLPPIHIGRNKTFHGMDDAKNLGQPSRQVNLSMSNDSDGELGVVSDGQVHSLTHPVNPMRQIVTIEGEKDVKGMLVRSTMGHLKISRSIKVESCFTFEEVKEYQWKRLVCGVLQILQDAADEKQECLWTSHPPWFVDPGSSIKGLYRLLKLSEIVCSEENLIFGMSKRWHHYPMETKLPWTKDEEALLIVEVASCIDLLIRFPVMYLTRSRPDIIKVKLTKKEVQVRRKESTRARKYSQAWTFKEDRTGAEKINTAVVEVEIRTKEREKLPYNSDEETQKHKGLQKKKMTEATEEKKKLKVSRRACYEVTHKEEDLLRKMVGLCESKKKNLQGSLEVKIDTAEEVDLKKSKEIEVENDDRVKTIFNSGKNKDGSGMKIPNWMLTEEMKLNYILQEYTIESSALRKSIVIRFRVPRRKEPEPETPIPTAAVIDVTSLHETIEMRIATQRSLEDFEAYQEDLGTRIEHRNEKKSLEVEINSDVVPVNSKEEDKESAEEMLNKKRSENGKGIEETMSSPHPTLIRSPRNDDH